MSAFSSFTASTTAYAYIYPTDWLNAFLTGLETQALTIGLVLVRIRGEDELLTGLSLGAVTIPQAIRAMIETAAVSGAIYGVISGAGTKAFFRTSTEAETEDEIDAFHSPLLEALARTRDSLVRAIEKTIAITGVGLVISKTSVLILTTRSSIPDIRHSKVIATTSVAFLIAVANSASNFVNHGIPIEQTFRDLCWVDFEKSSRFIQWITDYLLNTFN